MAKRSMDLLLSLLGLLVLAPLLLLVACWIKLDSRGPVFFRQERVGRFGVPFRIHKFRTMKDGASIDGPSITVGADAQSKDLFAMFDTTVQRLLAAAK